ncbi:receptor-like protein 37 [Humulus lupulus]|uniref:receptor-like protein 37 n=1 Tax=Humulus lupulus TaxID=3486 RepID=UPI002B409580|nr:receptor-like protein 37 [Humulus lupulus]
MNISFVFSWLFLMIAIYSNIDVVFAQCLSDQQSMLLQLKKNLVFDAIESKKLVQWNETNNIDCCSWDGVTCDEEGHVTGLSLGQESISGGIFDNSSLLDLQHLETLDFSSNNFESTIPASIGDLSTLSYLNLSDAGFLGQIPPELSQLTQLIILDLSENIWLGNSLMLWDQNLSIFVQNFSKLEESFLDGVNKSASGSEWCQALSSSVPKLRVLSLIRCDLYGPLDQVLENFQSLSVIRLDHNYLFGPVPAFFSNVPKLTSLHLLDCHLNGTFPSEIFQIQTIDISNNELLQGSLPKNFKKNNALQKLVLTYTNILGFLPMSMGSLSNLSILDLSNCEFSGEIPTSMEKLTQMVYLHLSFNKLTGQVPSFKMSKNLTGLYLSHNMLTSTISSSDFEGLSNLVKFDFSRNVLNGSIPRSLFLLPTLEDIDLSNNRFDGQLPESFNMSSSVLQRLDLSSNNLQGPIPLSIFKLPKLKFLFLSTNKFNGPILLDKIQGPSNPTTIDLSHNDVFSIASDKDTNWPSLSKLKLLQVSSCKLIFFPNL